MAVAKLLRLMQNLHQSTWGRKMYADRPSKDEQLLINFCEKPKQHEGGRHLRFRIHILFH
jgi:hypothetical protein